MKILKGILSTRPFSVSALKISAFADATSVPLMGEWKEKEPLTHQLEIKSLE